MKLSKGLKIFSLVNSAKSSTNFLPERIAGLRSPSYRAPTTPPLRLPSSSGVPRMKLRKESVVVTYPRAEPRTAFPNRPKGPSRAPPTRPTAIEGAAFFTFSLNSLLMRPPSLSPFSSALPKI